MLKAMYSLVLTLVLSIYLLLLSLPSVLLVILKSLTIRDLVYIPSVLVMFFLSVLMVVLIGYKAVPTLLLQRQHLHLKLFLPQLQSHYLRLLILV
ncbi:hypothetical protein EDC94DRAFT_614518 [Helicostylum pulchrum]|nr:hypothetical protein EDC94DRAFT_614518 [Helicostylum pulchrum]